MFPGYYRGWQWYVQWGTTAPLVGKQVFHEKKKLNIIHECQWPHWNSWSNVHLSFHLFSHLVGMYIYIYIYLYILVLLYWKYLIFGVMSLFPPPSPHFSCRKSGQRSQAARSLETRWVGSWRLMRASNVGWMGYGHPSHNGNPDCESVTTATFTLQGWHRVDDCPRSTVPPKDGLSRNILIKIRNGSKWFINVYLSSVFPYFHGHLLGYCRMEKPWETHFDGQEPPSGRTVPRVI